MGASTAARTFARKRRPPASRHYSPAVRRDMHAVAASRPMAAACVSTKMLLPLLLLLQLFAHLPVEALQCYDCLTKALPECSNGSLAKQFDQTTCRPDEIYCSVLIMNDTTGAQLVSRQCASREDEGEQLMGFFAGSHDNPLKVIKFFTCKSDFCNTQFPKDEKSALHGDNSKQHGGGNSLAATGKPADGGGGVRLSAAPLAVLSAMVGVLAIASLRPAA